MKLKKGDTVVITSGKDKGKRAKIESFFANGEKVFLPGLNLYKRHWKKRSEKDQAGIRELSRPVLIANVALICPKCAKPTRVGWKIEKDEKTRICRKCNKNI